MLSHEELLRRATHIKLACFDVDGTLTDGRLWFDAQGRDGKAFNTADGQGLKLLMDYGVEVAWITARHSESARARAADLGIHEVHTSAKDKLAVLHEIRTKLGLELHQIAFFGDDLPDLPCLRVVGLAAVPANAHSWLLPFAHWQTQRGGGDGAARELCDLILEASGHRASILARWGGA